MTFVQTFSIFAFGLFSIVDLRNRIVPLIDIFFVLIGIFVFGDNPWHVLALTVAVIWGSFQRVPSRLAFPLVFYPMTWPILLVGLGVRRNLVGRADLFALGTISFLFPISAVVAALVGFEFWRRWWVKKGNCGYVPAIPGMFLGLAIHYLVQISSNYFILL